MHIRSPIGQSGPGMRWIWIFLENSDKITKNPEKQKMSTSKLEFYYGSQISKIKQRLTM